jgi:eukaryotic-like serine/threonine-protein kinase
MRPQALTCDHCGATIDGDDATCPACLLTAALEWEDDANEPTEQAFSSMDCGDWLLEKIIGRGGSGVVYQAMHRHSGKQAAVKMLAGAHAAGPEELSRFRIEMEAGLRLDHPHLVKVLDVGESSGVPFYVMAFAEGGTLDDLLRLPPEKDKTAPMVALMVKVSRAVQFAHERGVLHRDLKPANILLDAHGEPMVADFGLARLLHAPAGVTLTGAALGTPAYMSPEQATGRTVTTATDIFSLGAILFHALTGRPPFQGESTLEILRQVTGSDAPDPSTLAPWVDRDLATVCLTALRRDPAGRYSSVAAFADDLERWQRGGPVMARPLSLAATFGRWCRRHPVAAAILLTGTAAGTAMLGLYVAGSMMLEEERNRAVRHEAEARASAAAAVQARDESQRNAYAADVYLGFRALDDGHLGQARRMLARHEPQARGRDLRGFEWHALKHLCRGDDTACWRDHTAAVTAVAFHPREPLLASAGRDGRIILREVPDGKIRLQLPSADAPRGIAEITAMASIAVSSEEFGSLTIGAKTNPDELRMRGRPSKLGEIHALAWSADGKHLLSGGGGCYIRKWSMPDGRMSGLIPVLLADTLGFSSDGSRITVLAPIPEKQEQHQLRIYQADRMALVKSFPGIQFAHAISPDGNSVAIMPAGGTVIEIIDVATATPRSRWDGSVRVKRLAFSADGSSLLGVDAGGMLAAVWRTSDGLRTGSVFPVSGKFDRILPAPDGRHIAATGAAQMITYQSMTGTTAAKLLRGHEDSLHAITFSPDGRFLASGGNDHTVRLWSLSGPSAAVPDTTSFASRPEPAPDILARFGVNPAVWASSPQGFWIGDGLPSGRLGLYSSPDCNPLRSLTSPTERYLRLVGAPDGSMAALSWPRTARLMAPGSDRWSPPLRLSDGTVGPLVFSADGRWLASGGDDNMICIRDCNSSALISTLRGHQDGLVSLAFTPDGKTLASSAKDRTLRLWHTPTWRDLGILHHGEILIGLEFSYDGLLLMGKTGNGETRVFGGGGR